MTKLDDKKCPDCHETPDGLVQCRQHKRPEVEATESALTPTKMCPACSTIYTDPNLVVCKKDRTMLLSNRRGATGDWWEDSRNCRKKYCKVCHQEFESDLWFCPNDNTTLRVRDIKLVEAPLLEGRYKPTAHIADLASHSIYSGVDEETNAPIVFKLLSLSFVFDKKTESRFLKHSAKLQELDHPNILKVHAVSIVSINNRPVLTCELIEADSVSHRILTAGRLSLNQFLDVFIDVCKGLEYAHANDAYHGSLTNESIFIPKNREDRKSLIGDFYLAERLFQDVNYEVPASETHTVNVYGSISVLCPDFAKGVPPSAMTDQYQLGCCMYEAATGRPPFSKEGMAQVFAHLSDEPDAFKGTEEVPLQLQSIILKCLAKTPEQRFGSISAVRASLEELHQTQS